jgi:hypothetical protein
MIPQEWPRLRCNQIHGFICPQRGAGFLKTAEVAIPGLDIQNQDIGLGGFLEAAF